METFTSGSYIVFPTNSPSTMAEIKSKGVSCDICVFPNILVAINKTKTNKKFYRYLSKMIHICSPFCFSLKCYVSNLVKMAHCRYYHVHSHPINTKQKESDSK